jgi:ABC-2 type transport system ATP-binding protein
MEPIITLRNLTKSYGKNRVLKGIDLDIYPGQVIGYIGPNGAGKSTTVKILCGILPEFGGEVRIAGKDLRTEPVAIKALIGYVPEQAELYDVLTPAEFLSLIGDLYDLAPEVTQERTLRMLTALGLKDNLHQRMDTFSKGMKQKVLITAGLIHNPQIVILDEPLSGLDANSIVVIKDLITRLAREGKTIFYCSHLMDVVERVSDRIVLIHQGAVIANGTLADLKTQLGEKSLEQMFSNLTGGSTYDHAAGEILNSLNTGM